MTRCVRQPRSVPLALRRGPLRALIVVLWRAGLRIGEALALADLEPWEQLRIRFPVGALFCATQGPTARRETFGNRARAPTDTRSTSSTATRVARITKPAQLAREESRLSSGCGDVRDCARFRRR